MSITASEMTPADIRAVTDGNNGGYGGGWGGDWSAWIIIFLIFGFFGWGGNGWGGGFGGRGSGAGVVDGYVLASDFSNIERKIDSVNNGVCDGFYAMNTGMLNGFPGGRAFPVQSAGCLDAAAFPDADGKSGVLLRKPRRYSGRELQSGYPELRNPEHGTEHHPGYHRRYELWFPLHRPAAYRTGAGGKGPENRRSESATVHGAAGGEPECPEPDDQGLRS